MGKELLWHFGAVELARMIREREVTSREVVSTHLDRIEAVNPQLNAIVRVLADEALSAADAADRALATGKVPGVLHGVPFTVKENIDLAGTPTTQGVPALAKAVATLDAPVVQRMRAAGGIPIGRTNLPDFGLRVHTDSALHGLTRNPWHPGRTTGGSSGGEAAALASGMSPIGLGNDIGGSLRNPANCCGIASIKPSVGAVPWATVIPPMSPMLAFQMMCVEGVMARRVADVRTGFLAVAGAHPRDPIAIDARFTDLAPGERLRVAVMAEPPGNGTHPGIAAAVRAAADTLARLGYDVVEATPPDYLSVVELWARLLNIDLRLLQPELAQVMGADGLRFLEFGMTIFPKSDRDQAALLHAQRHALAKAWKEWMAEYPVLLCPVWTQPAFAHGFDIGSADQARAVLDMLRPVMPASFLGTPAVVVPAGMADGLPVGVQVMGWRFSDLRCLAVAEQIESAQRPITPIDPRLSDHT